MTLDQFLPRSNRTKVELKGIYVEERCSNPRCRKILGPKQPKYVLRIKGKEAPYCQPCAKEILRPQENTGADL